MKLLVFLFSPACNISHICMNPGIYKGLEFCTSCIRSRCTVGYTSFSFLPSFPAVLVCGGDGANDRHRSVVNYSYILVYKAKSLN